ncbi:hypothetical protein [Moraxella oblonga]|uniref:hypothetical protein n=1 Tax=Moraxella oblonga TaxID=200413 RepID=UPI000835EE18|nr:hypothetical protein [Moraxella oblonga]
MTKPQLVTIERQKVGLCDLYGFILKESKNLLMIRQVSNLRLDGILIINKKEISDYYTNLSNEYQTQMLKEFGIYQTIDFKVDYDIKNWKQFFKSSIKEVSYFDIDENAFGIYLYYLGKLVKIKKHSILLHQFSGAGNWDKKPTKIYYDHISTCGIGTTYLQTYVDYFKLTHNELKIDK